MDFLIVAGVLFLIVMLAGWPWVRPVLAFLGISFARVNVLSWSSPEPTAKGAYMTFVGVEIGHRFFGMVTSQEAYVAQPEPQPKSRIVMP
jgi:hypothetical protein